MQAKPFLILNPLVYNSIKKYIWISDTYESYKAGQQTFSFLLKNHIYVDGFVTNVQSLVNSKIYNKPFVHVDSIALEKTAVFYDAYYEDLNLEEKYKKSFHKIRIFNSMMNNEEVVIWGAGITGESVYTFLTRAGIKIKCFIDSDMKLIGGMKCRVPICPPEQLEKYSEDVTVIEAMENWEEVDKTIEERYQNRFYFSLREKIWSRWKHDFKYLKFSVNEVEKDIFGLHEFYSFIDKKVYIYGNGDMEKEFAKCLLLMDYDFSGFLVDDRISDENSDKNEKYPILRVEEILYERNFIVWMYGKEKEKKLYELGLERFKDYVSNIYDGDISRGRQNQLDINLGYNYITGQKYPGIMVYGDEKQDDYKIAILGGSTSDGALYSFKSWPELLHEKLSEKVNLTIYNGGMCGYTSAQEMIKLIRDILPLKPDMIIVYDGFNEYGNSEQYPLLISYLRQVFEFSKKYIEDGFIKKDSAICMGIEQSENMLDHWMFNLRCMHGIAKEWGIKFFSFIQPMLMSKKGKTTHEKNILNSWDIDILRKWTDMSIRAYIKNRKLSDYMYDLSNIFDGEINVYMDPCHVWEKGNRIIATEIKNIILPVLDWE